MPITENQIVNALNIIIARLDNVEKEQETNKKVNLEYYAEDELDDIGVDDYSDCDGREELETLGDAGMDIYQ